MKQKTISRTYRIKTISVKQIEKFAKTKKISQGKAIEKLIQTAMRYFEEKQLEKELDEISNDEAWMKTNTQWADLDLN